MHIYLEIIKFNFLKYITYPLDAFVMFFERIASILVLIIFWSIFTSSTQSQINFQDLIAYFFVSRAITDLAGARGFRFGRSIQKVIKSGQLTNYMLRPLNLLSYLYSDLYIGKYGGNLILSFIFLVIGLAIKPPTSIENVILFIFTFIIAIILAIAINIILSCVQFYTTEGGVVVNVTNHTYNVFSGSLIPLFLFPEPLKSFILFQPFAAITFAPTLALQSANITESMIYQLISAVIWAFVLCFIAFKLWNFSIKNYEGHGI